MAYTGHGHHIKGTGMTGTPPKFRKKCGGYLHCSSCRVDAEKYAEVKDIPVRLGNSLVGKARLVNNNLLVEVDFDDTATKSIKELVQAGLMEGFSIAPILTSAHPRT